MSLNQPVPLQSASLKPIATAANNNSLLTDSQQTEPKPMISKLWYKNYMVWIFVIGFPLAMVITCIWLLFYSIKIEDPVVRDDWFMDAKALYADVSKDKFAHDIGLSGVMTINPTGNVSFMLSQSSLVNHTNTTKNQPFVYPQQLKIEISHATQKQKDRDFMVTHQSDNSYSGHVTLDNNKGKYYIIVHDIPNTWRLRDTVVLPSAKILKFIPLQAFNSKT